MKTLHLLRHAKSSWDHPGLSDRERPLNKRGERDAPLMGKALSGGMSPMSIAVSPARRAQLTLAGLCRGWPALGAAVHCTEEDLYTFSSEDLWQWIMGQQRASQALFIIAHNPALTDLVNTLTGHYVLDNLPTGGYVQLALQIDEWQDLLQGCAVLEQSLYPRALRVR